MRPTDQERKITKEHKDISFVSTPEYNIPKIHLDYRKDGREVFVEYDMIKCKIKTLIKIRRDIKDRLGRPSFRHDTYFKDFSTPDEVLAHEYFTDQEKERLTDFFTTVENLYK